MALAFALGLGTKNQQSSWLEVYYPSPVFQPHQSLVDAVEPFSAKDTLSHEDLFTLETLFNTLGNTQQAELASRLIQTQKPVTLTLLHQDQAPTTTPEAYLKLHLISYRYAKPHSLVLEGIFGLLPNNAWTQEGAIDLEELPERQLQARLEGRPLNVMSLDKFPKMTDYVVPTGVRIADTARVRLGAYIGSGTTVMHEGFVNFNAGTEGPSMVEGRISAGVFVGSGSDLGGGCSTMGTLSGGGDIVITVGKDCLIGANAGTGIPLGDRCTIESGLYITASSKIHWLANSEGKIVKGRDLAGVSDLLFRRHSQSGAIEALSKTNDVRLNEDLHTHQ